LKLTDARPREGADTNIRRSIAVATAVTGTAAGVCNFAVPAAEARTGWRVVARGHSNLGSANSSSVAARVRRPHALAVRLSVQQGVTARIQWSLSCTKSSPGHGGRSVTTSGRFGAHAASFRSLPMPIKNPDACDVIVNVLAGANTAIATDYAVDIRLDLLQR